VSIGLARAPEDARERSALIALADAALAAAKRAGRNCVVQAADLRQADQWLPQAARQLIGETLATAGTEDTVSLLRERLVALAEQVAHRHASAELIEEAVVALARAIAARDPHTADHPDAVGRLAALIGRELGQSPRELDQLALAGRLHDIGAVDLPEELLARAEELTPRERALVRRHPSQGARILEPLSPLAPVLPGILHHHERFDGGGYPAGLKGEEIPLLARVVAVADTYDSLVSGRAYRPALPPEQARRELRHRAGASLDPTVVEAFLRGLRTED
jgi:HD-GYP domain-containing protein (c-di-GMP phosphodiesterase class II)